MNRQQQLDSFLFEAHKLALSHLRERPELLSDVSTQLARWRAMAGSTRSDGYWDEWGALLDAGADAIERAACGNDEHAAVLRSVSPMSVLISQRERAQLLRDARRTA